MKIFCLILVYSLFPLFLQAEIIGELPSGLNADNTVFAGASAEEIFLVTDDGWSLHLVNAGEQYMYFDDFEIQFSADRSRWIASEPGIQTVPFLTESGILDLPESVTWSNLSKEGNLTLILDSSGRPILWQDGLILDMALPPEALNTSPDNFFISEDGRTIALQIMVAEPDRPGWNFLKWFVYGEMEREDWGKVSVDTFGFSTFPPVDAFADEKPDGWYLDVSGPWKRILSVVPNKDGTRFCAVVEAEDDGFGYLLDGRYYPLADLKSYIVHYNPYMDTFLIQGYFPGQEEALACRIDHGDILPGTLDNHFFRFLANVDPDILMEADKYSECFNPWISDDGTEWAFLSKKENLEEFFLNSNGQEWGPYPDSSNRGFVVLENDGPVVWTAGRIYSGETEIGMLERPFYQQHSPGGVVEFTSIDNGLHGHFILLDGRIYPGCLYQDEDGGYRAVYFEEDRIMERCSK